MLKDMKVAYCLIYVIDADPVPAEFSLNSMNNYGAMLAKHKFQHSIIVHQDVGIFHPQRPGLMPARHSPSES